MSTIAKIQPKSQTGNQESVVPDIFSQLARRMSAGLRRTRDAQHLKEMPDYLLTDVGINRADIDAALTGDAVKPRR